MPKTDVAFFEALAKYINACFIFSKSNYGKENVFMIQLPRPEKAKRMMH